MPIGMAIVRVDPKDSGRTVAEQVRENIERIVGTLIKDRKTIIRGVKHEARAGKPLRSIVTTIMDGWSYRTLNLTVKDEIQVIDHDGVVGDSFRIFWDQQAPEFMLPLSQLPRFIASPGTTAMRNDEAWAQYGKAFAGSVMPATAHDRTGIVGKIVEM